MKQSHRTMNDQIRHAAGLLPDPPRNDKGQFVPSTLAEIAAVRHGAKDPRLVGRLLEAEQDGSDDEERLQRLKEEHSDLFHADTSTASTGAATGAQAMNAAIRGARSR